MAEYLFVVFTNPVDGREDDYNAWYTNQHLGDVLKVPGLVSAQRFKFAGSPTGAEPPHRYMALYKVEADHWKTASDAIGRAVGSGAMIMSDAVDLAGVNSFYVTPITEERTRA